MSGPLGGQRAADVVAVELGQVAIEHDDVVRRGERLLQRGGAVARQVDRHALAAQAAGHRVAHPGLVLRNQHAHVAKPDGAVVKGAKARPKGVAHL